MWTYLSKSAASTIALGKFVGERLPQGAVVSLDGSLGAGKTCMVKGLANGVTGIHYDEVNSPAYSLVNEYSGVEERSVVYHIDFYRLEVLSPEDFEMFDEYISCSSAIKFVEWGDRFLSSFSTLYLKIVIDFSDIEDGDDVRLISVRTGGCGNDYDGLIRELENYAVSHH